MLTMCVQVGAEVKIDHARSLSGLISPIEIFSGEQQAPEEDGCDADMQDGIYMSSNSVCRGCPCRAAVSGFVASGWLGTMRSCVTN